MEPRSFASLLKDVATLLHPRSVVMLEETTANSKEKLSQHQNVLLALSDLHALFSRSPSKPVDHVAAKIAFYAGQVLSTDAVFFEGLAEEVDARGDREGTEGQDLPIANRQSFVPHKDTTSKSRIVELD